MPTYVYRCEKCGKEHEVRQRITDEPLSTCPECSGPLKRVIFGGGVIFKGNGYYTTDYVKNSSEKNGSAS